MNQAVKTSICSALIVDREAFLWECFAQQVPDPIREQLRTCAPAAAGIDEQRIEQVSRALIHAHAARASAASLSASLAQGILRLFTIPVEYAAFVYEALRLTQKLLYLHTGMRQEQLLSHHQLSGYLYIFFWRHAHPEGIRHHAGGADQNDPAAVSVRPHGHAGTDRRLCVQHCVYLYGLFAAGRSLPADAR